MIHIRVDQNFWPSLGMSYVRRAWTLCHFWEKVSALEAKAATDGANVILCPMHVSIFYAA